MRQWLTKLCAALGLGWCVPKMPEKKPYIPTPPRDIQAEIEVFRKEEEAAQQTFFAYLGIRDLLVKRKDVLDVVNENAIANYGSKSGPGAGYMSRSTARSAITSLTTRGPARSSTRSWQRPTSK